MSILSILFPRSFPHLNSGWLRGPASPHGPPAALMLVMAASKSPTQTQPTCLTKKFVTCIPTWNVTALRRNWYIIHLLVSGTDLHWFQDPSTSYGSWASLMLVMATYKSPMQIHSTFTTKISVSLFLREKWTPYVGTGTWDTHWFRRASLSVSGSCYKLWLTICIDTVHGCIPSFNTDTTSLPNQKTIGMHSYVKHQRPV